MTPVKARLVPIRCRTARWAAATLLLLLALITLLGTSAQAEPSPTPQPSATSTPAPTPAPDPDTSTAPPQTTPAEPPGTGPAAPGDSDRPPASDGQGVLGPLTATDPDGVPLDHYDITADQGAWNEVDRKLLLWFTNGLFSLVRVLIGLVAWLLNWGFQFGPAHIGIEPAQQVADAYQTQVIDRLGLPVFFLTLAAAWCGVMFLRGRKGRGAGELGITLLISALAATLLAQPTQVLLGDHGVLGQTHDTSMAIASITATGGRSAATDPKQASKPLTDTLVTTFVVDAHQMLNYGEDLDAPGKPSECLSTYKKIVKEGPWGGDDEPRNWMSQAGCKKLADYNHDPTWDRLLGALLLLIAALLIAVLILLMVGILLTATAALAFYAMLGHAVFVIALLPGGGRGVLWRWVGGIIKVVLVLFAVVVFLPLLSIFIGALVNSTEGQPLVVRFFLIDVVAAAGLVYHRKLVTFGTRAGYRIARRLERSRIGGSLGGGYGYGGYGGDGYGGYGGYGYGGGMGMGWLGSGDPSGLSPVSFGALHTGARREIHRVTDPVTWTARTAKRAWVGPASATSKAQRRLPEDASELRSRMYRTRAGRVAWRGGKSVTTAGRLGFEYTLGLPVTLERDYTTARGAAADGAEKAKDAAAVVWDRGRAVRDYSAHWARNTGMTAAARAAAGGGRAVGDQVKFVVGSTPQDSARAAQRAAQSGKEELQQRIGLAKLRNAFDPETARRYLDERPSPSGSSHRVQMQPATGDKLKAGAASVGKHTGRGAFSGSIKGAAKGFATGGTTGAKIGAQRGAMEGAREGAQRGTDPAQLAKELQARMKAKKKPPPST